MEGTGDGTGPGIKDGLGIEDGLEIGVGQTGALEATANSPIRLPPSAPFRRRQMDAGPGHPLRRRGPGLGGHGLGVMASPVVQVEAWETLDSE